MKIITSIGTLELLIKDTLILRPLNLSPTYPVAGATAGLRRILRGRLRPAIRGIRGSPHRRPPRRRVSPAPFFLVDVTGREGARGQAREGPRKRRRGRAAPAQQRQRWGLRGRGLERRRDTADPEDRRGGCTCSAVVRRDGAGELLPSPVLFAEAPDRRLAKGGGVREFTDKIFHRSRMRFKEMSPFFSRT